MSPTILIVLVAGATAMGLLVGQLMWKFYIAFSMHNPDCPYKDQVIEESKRVVMDVTQLTQGRNV